MFSNTKPAFGVPSNNTTFGFSSNVTNTPFGQSTFGKPATTGFGTPFAPGTSAGTFGQPTQTKPSYGGGFFGAPSVQSGSFGAQNVQSSSFGSQNVQSGSFGAQNVQTCNFGAQNVQSGSFGAGTSSVFGQQNKFPAFGFGPVSSSGFFGQSTVQPQQSTAGVFGQNTSSVFGNASGFGIANTLVGTSTKFAPVSSSDTVFRNGLSHTVSTRHQCITFMKEYDNKSLEELRWEDYQLNRKQGSQAVTSVFSNVVQPTQNIFGSSVATSGNSVFGQTFNKGISGMNTQSNFGQTNQGFGTVPSLGSTATFGKTTSGFAATSNAPSFNTFNTNPPQQVNLFGTNTANTLFPKTSQPSNIFAQPTSGFGAQTSLSTFGPKTNQNIFAGLNQSSLQNTLFSGSNTTGLTGFNTIQPNQNLFNKPVSSLFGPTNSANLGTNTSIFGNNLNKLPSTVNNNLGLFNSGYATNNINPTFGLSNMNMQYANNPNQNQINSEEQILYMSATPYGIPKLLNNVTEVSNDLKDVARFTTSAELKTLINTVNKASSNASFEKLEPVPIVPRKYPLFDGLEEKDYNLVSNFRICNNPKRLTLRLISNADDKSSSIWTDVDSVTDFARNTESDLSLGCSAASIDLSECDKDINNDVVLTSYEKVHCVFSVTKDPPKVLAESHDEIEQELYLEARETIEEEEDTLNTVESEDDTPVPTETVSEPHPTGIVLNRAEYYTIPPLEDLLKFINPDGTCVVQGFTIGRTGYGNVYFPDSFDVSNLNLDEIVHIRHKEINIYPDDSKKPPLGEGLNRKAQVTLDNVWPFDKNLKKLITDVDTLNRMEYGVRLRRVCEKQNTRFVEYRPETGSWVFKVEHFSKYSLEENVDDSEDEVLQTISNKPITENVIPENPLPKKPNDIRSPSKKRQVDSSTNNNPFINYNLHDSMELIKVPKMSTQNSNDHHLEMMKQTFFDEKTKFNGAINNYLLDYEDSEEKNFDSQPKSPERSNMFMEYDDCQTILNHFDDDEVDEETTFFDVSSEDVRIDPQVEVLPYHVTGFKETDLADIIMFKGRSFKVGWGKGLIFTHLTTRQNIDTCQKTLGTILQSRSETDYSSALIQVISLIDLSNSSECIFKNEIDLLLTDQFLASEYDIEDGVPHFKSSFGFDLLDNHLNSVWYQSKSAYFRQIWYLCHALWGKLDKTGWASHDKTYFRRKLVSDWLEDAVSEQVEENLHKFKENPNEMILEDIYTYISGNKLQEAALTAFKSNYLHLSLLIPLLSTNLETKAFIYKQLDEWTASNILNHINKTMLKLYMLLAGKSNLMFEDKLIHVYEDLDWMRTLGIFLWFLSDPAYPLKYVIRMYEEAFQKGICTKPSPHYLNPTKNIYDLRYQLLKFYSDSSYPSDKLLNPFSYTDDPLNYSFSWLILQILSSFGFKNISSKIQLHIHMNFAAQLERLGLWYWSVFVLLFIDDFYIRKQSVINIIERNVQRTPEYLKLLIQKFHIPRKWLDSARFVKNMSFS